MKDTIKLLRELDAAATPGPWLTEPFTTTPNNMSKADAAFIVEMRNALPQLLDRLEALGKVVEAAQDFLDSDGDYFSWTEDERHCLSRLRETVLVLKERE